MCECAVLRLQARELGQPQLEDAARSLGRLRSRVDAVEAQVVAELAKRLAPGAESFLRKDLKLSGRDARAKVATAEGLEELPSTAAALEAGEITGDHARLLARGASTHDLDEGKLLDAARVEPADVFAKTVRRAQNAADADGGVREYEKLEAASKGCVFTRDDDGMTVAHAELDPVRGEMFANAHAYWVEQLWRAEHGPDAPLPKRTSPQRSAAAFVAMAEHSLPGKPANSNGGGGGGGRVSVMVIADYDATVSELVAVELVDGTPIPVETARRLACDADILPAVFDGASQRTDYGRDRRLPTTGQRKAVTARDRHCVAPGCAVPPRWCQIHHIDHWTRHLGPTNLDNLCLLCSKHHHLVHEGGWTITRTRDGTYTLDRPAYAPEPRARPPNLRPPSLSL